jgi:hypothetical protein
MNKTTTASVIPARKEQLRNNFPFLRFRIEVNVRTVGLAQRNPTMSAPGGCCRVTLR